MRIFTQVKIRIHTVGGNQCQLHAPCLLPCKEHTRRWMNEEKQHSSVQVNCRNCSTSWRNFSMQFFNCVSQQFDWCVHLNVVKTCDSCIRNKRNTFAAYFANNLSYFLRGKFQLKFCQFLYALAKERKATISFVVFVCRSTRLFFCPSSVCPSV
jgi:hypothetical protein